MAFHHRKLLNDSLIDPIQGFCEPYCNPVKNPDGSCPLPCISRCYPICNHPSFYEFPPPPPDYTFLSDDNHHSKPSRLSIFLTISLAVLATTFLIFTVYTIYKFYKARYRNRSRQSGLSPHQQQQQQQPPEAEEEARLDFLDEDHGPLIDHPIWYIRTVGLQPSVISAINICKYKRGDGLVEGTECSVCLNEFQEDETLRLLPKCNHAFHIPCIDTWLRSHTNCPNCRAKIVMSTGNFQPSAQSHRNSGRLVESQVGVSENNGESQREPEVLGVSSVIEDADEPRDGIGNGSRMEDVGNSGDREEEGVQPLRRSVSMDSLSALKVSAAIANAFPVQSDRNSDENFMQMNVLNMGIAPKRAGNNHDLSKSEGSSSMEGSLQKDTSLVKRSLSCSAKVFLSRYNRSRSSIVHP